MTNNGNMSIAVCVREALLDRGFLASDDVDLEDLRSRTDEVWRAIHNLDWPLIYQELPVLLQGVDGLVRCPDRSLETYRIISDIYQATASVMSDIGEIDLAWICADRAITFAEQAPDGLGVASGFFRLGHVALRCGRHRDALRISHSGTRSIDELSADMTEMEIAALKGSLNLIRAIAYARMGDASNAQEAIDVARHQADLIQDSINIAHTEFGQTNLKLHEISVYVDLGLAGKAMDIIDTLTDIDLSVERRVRFLIDVFRAQYMLRDYRGMDKTLPEAYALSPEKVRGDKHVREILDRIKLIQPDLPEALAATVGKLA